MWELEKAILVTNNDRVYEKYKDQMKVILLDGYEDVLIKVRDLVYDKHVLLTHPQASSLKPNQTPYRSVVVYPKGEEDNIKDIMLIDKCLQVYLEWQYIAPSPKMGLKIFLFVESRRSWAVRQLHYTVILTASRN